MTAVTGATGHLGQALVHELDERGETISVLLRSQRQRPLIPASAVVHEGDITDTASLVRAFTGADTVYHTAALISIVPKHSDALHRVNVAGTENVIRACREAGVRRLVYTSSIEALGIGVPGLTVTEGTSFDPDHAIMEYGRTKALASIMVQNVRDFETIIVSPTAIIGPFDRRPSALGRMIYDAMSRKLIGYPDGGFDFVDVRDVAVLHILAAERARAGEKYIAAGTPCSVHELMLLIERLSGVRRPMLRMSASMARVIARFMELWYAVSHTDPMFTVKAVDILQMNPSVSSEKAKRELGYTPRPLETTVADTIAWFRRTLDKKK
ncbi:MAG: SDR family oxidoreductase [Spirochaetota bacterium]